MCLGGKDVQNRRERRLSSDHWHCAPLRLGTQPPRRGPKARTARANNRLNSIYDALARAGRMIEMADEKNRSDVSVRLEGVEAKGHAGSVGSGVKPGELSWNFFYVAFAFVVTFIGTIIQLSSQPLALILFLVLSVIAGILFFASRRFQTKI